MSDDEPDVTAQLAHVVRNGRILSILQTRDGATLSELADSTDGSESNINRTVNRLAANGLVAVDDTTEPYSYSLTFLGRHFSDWLEEGQELLRQSRMYTDLPATVSLPRWLVSEGTVAVATADDVTKHRVFDQVLDFISRVDRFHVVAPALTRDATFYHIANNIRSEDLSVEVTFPASFLDALQSRFPDEMDDLFSDHDVTGFVFPETVDVPYGFGLGYVEEDGEVTDAAVAVVCYDEQHHSANGTVINDTPQAVAWAEERYARYRERATEWTPE